MQSPPEILGDIWTQAGGDPSALDTVTLTGEEPQLPSSFRVAAAAQASIAATGLAAAEIWKLRSGQSQDVAVDMRHAVVECRSERYLRVDGKPPPPAWDAIAGIYKNSRPALRAAAHQFPASSRRRLQGSGLQAGARRGSGCADAMGRRGVRDRGLCRRRRGRDDALASGMVGVAACRRTRRIAAGLDREDRRGRAKTVARGRAPAGRRARARSVARDRGARRRPYACRARRRCAPDFRSRSAGDPLADHRYRPRQADEPY